MKQILSAEFYSFYSGIGEHLAIINIIINNSRINRVKIKLIMYTHFVHINTQIRESENKHYSLFHYNIL